MTIAHEPDRSCHSCHWWERFGGSPWGECLLAFDEKAGADAPLRFYLSDAKGGLITDEGHGCRAWTSRERN